jgi:hypothetical protein
MSEIVITPEIRRASLESQVRYWKVRHELLQKYPPPCSCSVVDLGHIVPVDQWHGTIILNKNCPYHSRKESL